ncbi:MAG: 2-amino-4-hydroxy-6-hydroxymethyldihydropteridine diphosphokinase [Muribaculaceae bacterium]|nr:2-amino-4-hydroxy-6-hydroxymethyldihydropteridine diphosphokinase [Muribaculaceae bacterium]
MTLSEEKEAIFSVGSNCGDRESSVAAGLVWLSDILSEYRCSSIYATPDCHGGQKEYMNAVAIGSTILTPIDLNRLCKEYELRCGRDSDARIAGEVPIDIDLVVYSGKVLREKDFSREFFQKGYRLLKDT